MSNDGKMLIKLRIFIKLIHSSKSPFILPDARLYNFHSATLPQFQFQTAKYNINSNHLAQRHNVQF